MMYTLLRSIDYFSTNQIREKEEFNDFLPGVLHVTATANQRSHIVKRETVCGTVNSALLTITLKLTTQKE